MYDELDILREVGSIAAAHGSIALSDMLGRRINVSVPSIDIISCVGIPTKTDVERVGFAIVSKHPTGLNGDIFFLLDEKNALRLIDLFYKISAEDKKTSVLTEMGMSLIKEIGGIIIGAYAAGLGMLLKRLIIPTAPILISGSMAEILSMVLSTFGDEDYALLTEAIFEEPKEKIDCAFYLVLSPDAASDIRQACKNILEELEKG